MSIEITFRPLWWKAFARNALLLQAVLWLFMAVPVWNRVLLGLAISVAIEVITRLMMTLYLKLIRQLYADGLVKMNADGVYEIIKDDGSRQPLPGLQKRHLTDEE
jgi:hypothetical protein